MAILKVPYSSLIANKYKPYLEVYYTHNKKISPKSFSLMDSGADVNMIGYQLGLSIGLPDLKEGERFIEMNGVGGATFCLERSCRVFIYNKKSNKAYGYEEQVYWVYPSQQIKNELTNLIAQHSQFTQLKTEAIPGTSLDHYFDQQILAVVQRIKQINALLETDPLLGRPFFNNFSHVQFIQRDKSQEHLCSFHFDVIEKRAVQILDLNS